MKLYALQSIFVSKPFAAFFSKIQIILVKSRKIAFFIFIVIVPFGWRTSVFTCLFYAFTKIDEIRNCLFAGSPLHKFLSPDNKNPPFMCRLICAKGPRPAAFPLFFPPRTFFFILWTTFFWVKIKKKFRRKSFRFITAKTINLRHLKFPENRPEELFLLALENYSVDGALRLTFFLKWREQLLFSGCLKKLLWNLC